MSMRWVRRFWDVRPVVGEGASARNLSDDGDKGQQYYADRPAGV